MLLIAKLLRFINFFPKFGQLNYVFTQNSAESRKNPFSNGAPTDSLEFSPETENFILLPLSEKQKISASFCGAQ